MESNDSPEIPDRGGDIRHPRPPFGGGKGEGERYFTTGKKINKKKKKKNHTEEGGSSSG